MALKLSRQLQCRHQKDQWRLVLTKQSQVYEIVCCNDCRNTLRELQVCDILEERMTRAKGRGVSA